MKLVTAVVKPDKLDDALHAASGAGARGLTVTEVRGFGQEHQHMEAERPADAAAHVQPKLRIDVLTSDELASPIADAIDGAVRTGAIGDGKIWICPVDAAVRVRTGERDDQAL
jgi:nitrogen regulatory protein PII